jgi:predicted nucleic acid-binding protein
VLAIDTNIVVRFLVRDEPEQAAKARALLEAQDVLLISSVLLESEWVLRNAYGLARRQVLDRLRAFVGLPHVKLQEPERAATALEWAEAGMDFADAFHLAAAEGCEAFASFDKRLMKTAGRIAAIPIRQP